ncbi:MAG TPA: hypothetical protein VJZ32_10250 [Candidatus Bathyarchaeia archaeon]|nr:hypothetical protein [Candidatus Bathyarchaeia archaeon]
MKKKIALIPIGIIMMLFGSVWFLQGINILPGSFMTGSSFWAVTGGVTDIIGLMFIVIGTKNVRAK